MSTSTCVLQHDQSSLNGDNEQTCQLFPAGLGGDRRYFATTAVFGGAGCCHPTGGTESIDLDCDRLGLASQTEHAIGFGFEASGGVFTWRPDITMWAGAGTDGAPDKAGTWGICSASVTREGFGTLYPPCSDTTDCVTDFGLAGATCVTDFGSSSMTQAMKDGAGVFLFCESASDINVMSFVVRR